jgi:hypothetical protein
MGKRATDGGTRSDAIREATGRWRFDRTGGFGSAIARLMLAEFPST